MIPSNFGNFCSKECQIEWGLNNREKLIQKAKKQRIKKEKEDKKKAKEGIKSNTQLLNEAQKEFNAYIREVDKNEPCISCQRFHDGQYHAGHYLSVGAHPELRFNEDNCHKQCSVCNNHLSGNQLNYRKHLIEKIGLERVERLEGFNDQKNYSRDEIRAIKEEYKNKLKQLKLEREK
jgi:hypothetical protein